MEDQGRVAGFGMLLRQYRLAAGLSQEALAERARMSINGVSALERGYRRTPQHETLALLAGALALDVEQRREFEAAAARSGLSRREASITVGPWPTKSSSNLPIALKSFVGREADLEEITTLVGDHRLVTLVGAGGLGKTQTALQVGRGLSNSTDAAVCVVALAPIADPSLIVATIASTLGVQEVPNRPLLGTLLAYLKSKALLLILDNCEHVIEQAAIVAETLLGGCPRLRILATSRESLRAAGEQIYRLLPLSVPSPNAIPRMSAAAASAYGAIVLFTERARAVDHRFVLSDETAPTVAELCRRLDGIPLAIELAAARVSQAPLKALTARLDDRFRILTGGERTAQARQQTMRATIDWSYDSLAVPEQRVFEQLSVFGGGCTLQSATAVCCGEEAVEADVFDLLSSLVNKSLLVLDLEGTEPRYRLLESFRHYAREKLATRGDAGAVLHRHAFAYLDLAQRLCNPFCPQQEALHLIVQEEVDNWRAALRWALTERGDILLGQRLIGELSVLWKEFAPLEGRRWLDAALELVDEQTPPTVLGRLSYAEASIAMALGQYEAELASSRTASVHYRAVGDLLGIILARSREAQALMSLGQLDEADSALREALELARREGDRWPVAWMLRLLGSISLARSDVPAARGYTADALRYYEAVDARLDIAWTIDQLADIDFHTGDVELALRNARDALAIFRTFNYARAVAHELNKIATLLVALARYGEAEQSAREALDLARDHQLDALMANALASLAEIAALQSDGLAKPTILTYKRAARILGFVNARLVAIGSQWQDERQYDRVLATLRDAMGADAVAKLLDSGAAMTEDQAVEATLD